MSGVEVYTINKDGSAQQLGTASNAWGFAIRIWEMLGGRYIGPQFSTFRMMLGGEAEQKPLWDIAYRADVSRDHRILMSSTFDRTWISKENLPEVIGVYERCNLVTPTIQQFVALLKEANAMDILGVGINSNSVSCDYWSEREEGRPFNFHQDALAPQYGEVMEVFNRRR